MRPIVTGFVALAIMLATTVLPAAEGNSTLALDDWLNAQPAVTSWSADELPSSFERMHADTGLGGGEGAIYDPAVELVQAASPMGPNLAPRRPVNLEGATRPALRTATLGTLASIPYMIGDTGAGTCLGFTGLLEAMLSHPTLACGRLNISEANSPIPTDRVYYSYRHFANASKVSAFTLSETLDLDQHVIAWENAFWDRTGSLELRVPIEQRLRSDIISLVVPDQFGIADALVAPGDGRNVELGNISLVFKMLLLERQALAISGGVGVTLPTAQDVQYQIAVVGDTTFPDFPGLTADQFSAFQANFANETIYLSPFLAWVVAPPGRWFHQGFMQCEVAANPSRVNVFGDGSAIFSQNGVPFFQYDFFTPTPAQVDLFAQTLLRVNLGWGYILAERRRGDRLSQLAGLFELHYTTTLEDANLSPIPLAEIPPNGAPLQGIAVGNLDNRVDLLNAAAGISGRWGPWIVTNGVISPIRPMPDRGFDFEYNCQVQRLF